MPCEYEHTLPGWQLLETSPDCVKLLSADGRLLAMNQNGLCVMEIDRFASIAGQPWTSLWPQQGHGAIEGAIAAARAGRTGSLKAFCPTAKGAPRWWDVIVTPVPDDPERRLLAISRDVTAAHQAERALQASEARLRLATEATRLGLWSWAPDSDTVALENPRAHEIFGLPHADGAVTVNRLLGEFVHPGDGAAFRRAADLALGPNAHFSFAGRIRHADGALRWVELFGRAERDAGGAPLALAGTVRDITERKLAEIERYESRERFQKIVSQAATGVVEMDTEGRVTFVNQKYADMLGYAPEELVGRPVIEVTAPGSVQETLATVARVVADGVQAVIDKEYLRKDGSTMPATSSVSALRGAAGEFQGIVAIVVDTTESKRAAEDLRISEERYRTLFESMDQGFCIIEMIMDGDGRPLDYRFVEMNPMFEQHTGLAGAAGRTILELVPDHDRFWIDTYGKVAQTGQAVRFESEATAMGRWFDVYATRIGEPGALRVALLFSDITARKQADERLHALAADLSEQDRRKTEFLATLAHELRNPLAPICNGLSVIRLSGDSAASVAKVRAMMERQVGHMVHLIDDLLDIARISGGKLELKKTRADLKAVLSSAVETSLPMIDAGRHTLHIDVPDAPLEAEADVTRIAQVVANLLNNAAKYTPAGGRIELSMRREGDSALITVADNGVGIPADSLTSVFDMFSQVGRSMDRAQGGLGIGLSLVRRLVDMHGGEVTAASGGAGAGSVFSVRLPLIPGTAAAAADPHAPAHEARAGARHEVLVVDDNADAANTLAMILELQGYSVRVAHDGFDALRQLEQCTPQLAFLDIGMPLMDGYETARAIRRIERLRGIRLVALTGWGAETDRQRSTEAGFDVHLTKPVQMNDLERILGAIET